MGLFKAHAEMAAQHEQSYGTTADARRNKIYGKVLRSRALPTGNAYRSTYATTYKSNVQAMFLNASTTPSYICIIIVWFDTARELTALAFPASLS